MKLPKRGCLGPFLNHWDRWVSTYIREPPRKVKPFLQGAGLKHYRYKYKLDSLRQLLTHCKKCEAYFDIAQTRLPRPILKPLRPMGIYIHTGAPKKSQALFTRGWLEA